MAKVKKVDLEGKGMKGGVVYPKGDYLVEIIDSDWVKTKKGDGHFVKLTMEILKGDYKGRKYYQNVNLDNPNPAAVEMAENEWASIHTAIGKSKAVKDTKELHKKPFIMSLYVKTDKETKEESNGVTGYSSVSDKKDKGKDKDGKKPWDEDGSDGKKDKGGKGKKDKGKAEGKGQDKSGKKEKKKGKK